MNKQDELKAEEIAKEYGIDFPEAHSTAYPLCYKAAMKMAAWKDEQFESDRLFLEEYKSRCHFYEEFMNYLNDECVGTKDSIIEAVAVDRIMYIGYVETEKEIKPNGDLVFKFKIDDLTYRATWQESDNYAVCQWTGYEPDDYKGYLLFPTFGFKKFFCVYYEC